MASGSIFDEAYQKANQKSPNPQIPVSSNTVSENHDLQVAPPATGVPGSGSTFGANYNSSQSGSIYQNSLNQNQHNSNQVTQYSSGSIGIPDRFNTANTATTAEANSQTSSNAVTNNSTPGSLSNAVPFEAIIPTRSSAVVVSPRAHHAENEHVIPVNSGTARHHKTQANIQAQNQLQNNDPYNNAVGARNIVANSVGFNPADNKAASGNTGGSNTIINNGSTINTDHASALNNVGSSVGSGISTGVGLGSAMSSNSASSAETAVVLNNESHPDAYAKYIDGSIYSSIDPNIKPQGSYQGPPVTPSANGLDAGNISLNTSSSIMSNSQSTNSEGYGLFDFIQNKITNSQSTAATTQAPSDASHSIFNQTFNSQNFTPGILLNEVSLIITLAVIIEMFIPISRRFKIEGLSNIFKGLGRKVNRSGDGSQQRAIAGILLPSLILTILFVLIFTLDALSDFDKIITLIVMIFLLDLKYPQDQSILVHRALKEGFNDKAKSLLEPMVLRECNKLSSMGIAKACCEATILRIFSGWFSVIVWYFIAGIEGALIMQTIVVLSRNFNYKLRGNYQFGRFIFRLHQIAIFIPACFLMLMLMFSRNPMRHFSVVGDAFKQYPAPVSGMVLAAVGASLDISLGGPRYYQGNVMRLPKLGGAQDPMQDSILKAMRKVRMCGLILLILSIVIGLNI